MISCKDIILKAEQGLESLQALIKEGIDINKQDKNGWTPLVYAILKSVDDDVIFTLLDAGANAEALCHDLYPIHYAAKMRSHFVIREFIRKMNNEAMQIVVNNHSPISLALLYNPGNAELLSAAGAKLGNIKLPLTELCIIYRNAIRIELTVEAQAILDLIERQIGHISKLTEKECIFNDENGMPIDPFSYVLLRKNVTIVKSIVTKGFDVTHKLISGVCLHLAISDRSFAADEITKKHKNTLEIIKFLLDKGAHEVINELDPDLESPLSLALMHNLPEVAELLIHAGADINLRGIPRLGHVHKAPIHWAIQKECARVLNLMIDKKVDCDKYYDEGNTIFTLALGRENSNKVNFDIIRILLWNGEPKVNRIDAFGDLPLHRAITLNQPEIVRMLLEKGANIEALNAKGKSPLSIAIESQLDTIAFELVIAGAKFTNKHNNQNIIPGRLNAAFRLNFNIYSSILNHLQVGHCKIIADVIEKIYCDNTEDHLLSKERERLLEYIRTHALEASYAFYQVFKQHIRFDLAMIHKSYADSLFLATINDGSAGKPLLSDEKIFDIMTKIIIIVMRINFLKPRKLEEIFKPYIEEILFEEGLFQEEVPYRHADSLTRKFRFPKVIGKCITEYYVDNTSAIIPLGFSKNSDSYYYAGPTYQLNKTKLMSKRYDIAENYMQNYLNWLEKNPTSPRKDRHAKRRAHKKGLNYPLRSHLNIQHNLDVQQNIPGKHAPSYAVGKNDPGKLASNSNDPKNQIQNPVTLSRDPTDNALVRFSILPSSTKSQKTQTPLNMNKKEGKDKSQDRENDKNSISSKNGNISKCCIIS